MALEKFRDPSKGTNKPFRMTRLEVDVLVANTQDSYSYDRYRSWETCAIILMDLGYDYDEARAILLSKHMRWAADASNKEYGKVNSSDLRRYLTQNAGEVLGEKLEQLVRET